MTDPLFAWSPPRKRTDGDLAAEYVSTMRLRNRPYVMDVHQRAILDDIYAEGDEPGIPVSFDVTTVGPRQATGKTGALITAGIYDMFVVQVDRHVWTAHLDRTVRGTFREMRALIASDPEKQALCKWPPTTGNGQRAIELHSGPRIEFFTRSTGGGRGEVGPRLTYDEALYLTDDDLDASMPTMATIDDAQVRLASSGGLGHSKVLRKYRDKGRAGGDPRSAYREFAVPFTLCATEHCEHPIEDPGCVLNDRELWRRWIPMARLSETRLMDFRMNMSPKGFAREFYTWWDEPDAAEHPIDAEAWKRAGLDPLSPNAKVKLEPVAISVECSEDLGISTVGVAGRRPDGNAQVEIAKRLPGTGWVVEFVVKRHEMHRPVAVVLDPSGPAGFLAERLRRAGVEVSEPTARQVAQACVDVVATVNEGKVTDPETGEVHPSGLVHTRDAVLTSAVLAAEVKGSGAFVRENEKADISALYAVALALHGLMTHDSGVSVYEERGLIQL